jgi:hypothetical protein
MATHSNGISALQLQRHTIPWGHDSTASRAGSWPYSGARSRRLAGPATRSAAAAISPRDVMRAPGSRGPGGCRMRLDGGLGSARISELRSRRPFVVTAAQIYWSPSERCRLGDNIVSEIPLDGRRTPAIASAEHGGRSGSRRPIVATMSTVSQTLPARPRVGSYRLSHGEYTCRLRFLVFQGS